MEIDLSKVTTLAIRKFSGGERDGNILEVALVAPLILIRRLIEKDRSDELPTLSNFSETRKRVYFRDHLNIYLYELVIRFEASTNNPFHSKTFSCVCVCVCVCVYPSSSLGWRYGINGNSGLCRQPN